METHSSQIPEGVNLDNITDEAINLFGLDKDRIDKLKETQRLDILRVKGRNFYHQMRRVEKLPSGGDGEKITIDEDFSITIFSGPSKQELPGDLVTKFKGLTTTPETEEKKRKLNAWISGYTDGAFEEKDWLTVYAGADSIGLGLEYIRRLKAVAQQDFDEGLRIAQTYENYRRRQEKTTPTPTPTEAFHEPTLPTQPKPTPTPLMTETHHPTPTVTESPTPTNLPPENRTPPEFAADDPMREEAGGQVEQPVDLRPVPDQNTTTPPPEPDFRQQT